METTRKKPGPAPTKGKDPMRSLRVPDQDWQAWKREAERRGLSLSQWLRQVANRSVSRSRGRQRKEAAK